MFVVEDAVVESLWETVFTQLSSRGNGVAGTPEPLSVSWVKLGVNLNKTAGLRLLEVLLL